MDVTLANDIFQPPPLTRATPSLSCNASHACVCAALVWHLVGLSLDASTADPHLWWQTPMHNSVWHSWDP